MLGWFVGVYKQQDGGTSPAQWETPQGARLAVWQTGLGGLDWLNKLVETGNAICLGGNGYPVRFTATAEHLLPQIMDDPPGAHENWLVGAGDLITSQWEGKTKTDPAAASQCRPGEWLLVEAWDES